MAAVKKRTFQSSYLFLSLSLTTALISCLFLFISASSAVFLFFNYQELTIQFLVQVIIVFFAFLTSVILSFRYLRKAIPMLGTIITSKDYLIIYKYFKKLKVDNTIKFTIHKIKYKGNYFIYLHIFKDGTKVNIFLFPVIYEKHLENLKEINSKIYPDMILLGKYADIFIEKFEAAVGKNLYSFYQNIQKVHI